MSRHKEVPVREDWDEKFCTIVRDLSPRIIAGKSNEAFKRYYEKKSDRFEGYHKKYIGKTIEKTQKKKETNSQNNNVKVGRHSYENQKVLFGEIARAEDSERLREWAKTKLRNRASINLTDLHELHLCLGESLDKLLGIDVPADSSDNVLRNLENNVEIVYLTENDVKNLLEAKAPPPNPLVVRCIPLLGLYLVMRKRYQNHRCFFQYEVIDALGNFCKDTENRCPKVISVFSDREVYGNSSNSAESVVNKEVNKFKDAVAYYKKGCTLAKGIIISGWRDYFSDRKDEPTHKGEPTEWLFCDYTAFFNWNRNKSVQRSDVFEVECGSFVTQEKSVEDAVYNLSSEVIGYWQRMAERERKESASESKKTRSAVDQKTSEARNRVNPGGTKKFS